MRKDMWFAIGKRNNNMQSSLRMPRRFGYAFTNVNPKMQSMMTRSLWTFVIVQKGNLVHFGEVNVRGMPKTRDKVIRRELRIKEGELYNGTRLRVSRRRIETLRLLIPG